MFQVEWLGTALDDLSGIWLQADSELRAAVVSATNEIDRRLAADAHGEGEQRPGRQRFTFVAPLSVIFRVEEDDRTVTVSHVRLYGRRLP